MYSRPDQTKKPTFVKTKNPIQLIILLKGFETTMRYCIYFGDLWWFPVYMPACLSARNTQKSFWQKLQRSLVTHWLYPIPCVECVEYTPTNLSPSNIHMCVNVSPAIDPELFGLQTQTQETKQTLSKSWKTRGSKHEHICLECRNKTKSKYSICLKPIYEVLVYTWGCEHVWPNTALTIELNIKRNNTVANDRRDIGFYFPLAKLAGRTY